MGGSFDLGSHPRSLSRPRHGFFRYSPPRSVASDFEPRRLFTTSSSSLSSSDSADDHHYQILGLSPQATQKEIKSAYIAKTKLYHPDTNRGKEAEARENFIRVVVAYTTLSSRRHRPEYIQQKSNEYDAELENVLRAVRNEALLTQERVDEKLKDREKYGVDESNWKFTGRAVLYFITGVGGVYLAMKVVEFTYGDIVAKRRRALVRRERLRREMELERKREG